MNARELETYKAPSQTFMSFDATRRFETRQKPKSAIEMRRVAQNAPVIKNRVGCSEFKEGGSALGRNVEGNSEGMLITHKWRL